MNTVMDTSMNIDNSIITDSLLLRRKKSGVLQVITSKEDAFNQSGKPTTPPYSIIITSILN